MAITISTLYRSYKVDLGIVMLILNGHNNRCMKMVKYVECIFTCIVLAMGFLLRMSARALVGLLGEDVARIWCFRLL